jgi:hypothetical protein
VERLPDTPTSQMDTPEANMRCAHHAKDIPAVKRTTFLKGVQKDIFREATGKKVITSDPPDVLKVLCCITLLVIIHSDEADPMGHQHMESQSEHQSGNSRRCFAQPQEGRARGRISVGK